jgi:opacity protein-like surface antigen
MAARLWPGGFCALAATGRVDRSILILPPGEITAIFAGFKPLAAKILVRDSRGDAPPPMLTKGPMLAKAPPLAPPVSSWAGFYVGGDAGAAWFSDPSTWNPLPDPVTFGVFPNSANDGGVAFLGGAHVGYNDQIMPDWVVGLEGDWSWSKAGGTSTAPWITDPGSVAVPGAQTTISANLNWIASARGRLGYLVTPGLMAYATGGAAWAKIDYSATATDPTIGYFAATNSSST